MCSEARGGEATAGTLQYRPSEIVAAPKVKKKTCALRAQHAHAAPTSEKKKNKIIISGVKHYDPFCNIHVKH